MDKFGLAAIAVIVIGFIECVALFMGVNGTVLATTMAVIAAIIAGTIGYGYGTVKNSSSKK